MIKMFLYRRTIIISDFVNCYIDSYKSENFKDKNGYDFSDFRDGIRLKIMSV